MNKTNNEFEVGDVVILLINNIGYETHLGSSEWFNANKNDVFLVLKMNENYKTNKNAYEKTTHFFYDFKRKMTGLFINSELCYFKKHKEK